MAKELSDLLGASEVAEAIGCSQQNLRKQAGLPEPVAKLRSGSVWTRDQVEKFIKARERRER